MSDDELAYMSAAEIADRIRRRDSLRSKSSTLASPASRGEIRASTLSSSRGSTTRAATRREAEAAVMSGAALGPLHGVPTAIKDLFDFKPGWPFTFGGMRAMKDCVAQWHCIFAERIEKAGAILLGKTNSPTMGLRGTCDNFLFGPTRNPFNLPRTRAARQAAAPQRSPTGWCRSRKAPTPAARSASRPHGAMWLASSLVRPHAGRDAAERFRRRHAVHVRRPDQPHGRGRRAGAVRARRIRPRDPFAIETNEDFRCRDPALDQGLEDRLQPRSRRLSGRAGGSRRRRRRPSKCFADAGADDRGVKLGLKRDQRELTDAWARLDRAAQHHRARGHEGLRHRPFGPAPRRLSAGLSGRIDAGQKLSAMDVVRDQAIRTRSLTTRSKASSPRTDPGVTDARRMPVDNADRRQHHGTDPRQRRRSRPADRLVPDLFHQLQRPSVDLGAGGAQRRLAGRHAAHRPAAKPMATCSPRRQHSNACSRGATTIAFAESAR